MYYWGLSGDIFRCIVYSKTLIYCGIWGKETAVVGRDSG